MQTLFDNMTNKRTDLREAHELRPMTFQTNIAPNATGSVLARYGNTQVICAASLEKKVPSWMIQQGVSGGWVTAEYSMLPYSTLGRKPRDSSKGRIDGRSVEIQRLIGRSMRAVIDLEKLPGYTLWIDCDVLQADGGTRTAAISGAYVAAQIAIRKLIAAGELKENPFKDSVAGISVGIHNDIELVDLCYEEDKDASVDFNIVMTGSGVFVELQGTGEEATFSEEQLNRLIALAKNSIQEITELQKQAITQAFEPSAPGV